MNHSIVFQLGMTMWVKWTSWAHIHCILYYALSLCKSANAVASKLLVMSDVTHYRLQSPMWATYMVSALDIAISPNRAVLCNANQRHCCHSLISFKTFLAVGWDCFCGFCKNFPKLCYSYRNTMYNSIHYYLSCSKPSHEFSYQENCMKPPLSLKIISQRCSPFRSSQEITWLIANVTILVNLVPSFGVSFLCLPTITHPFLGCHS